jgi:hypothetical protein
MGVKPLDGFVCNICGEMIVRGLGWFDSHSAAKQIGGLPLAGRAAQEAIEVLKAQTRGPMIKGTCGAHLSGRRVVPLAEGRRAVAVPA